MNQDKGKLESIFHAALELSTAEERAEYVRQACEGDDELRDRVTRMLRALKQSDSVFSMDGSGASEKLHADSSALISEGPGSLIGEYKLLQKIGEGGFGVVYMAEQRSPIVRKVALKIIKLGMDTRQVIARFEAERQALALLDHPNVAKVLGAGSTDSGRPYFCMELVNGLPITDFCDRNQSTTRDRLTLFGEVCEAVQHAHRKGLIHRDIKPSNILVTLHDGKPVPKVIDFGIAKAIGQRLTEKTLFTHFQQLIGTPAYMSPEQAEMSGLDIDTRTDVYSLGVLLYELLTGTTPFSENRLLSLAYGEMQRVITEEEPAKPSTRLSTMENEEVTAVAKHRKLEVSEVSRSVQGDLDLIVMKALDKDRSHRYDTPREIVADIERHLLNQPIMAAPPGFAYLFKKFYRRHRVALTTAAAFLTMLTLATVISIRFAFLANTQKNQAKEQGERASAAEQSAIERLSQVHAQLGISDLESNQPNGLLHLARAYETSLDAPGSLDFHRAQWMFWNHSLAGRLRHVFPASQFPHQSSDGRWIPTSGLFQGKKEAFRLWDPTTGEQFGADFNYPSGDYSYRVYRYASSPDESRIASMYYPSGGSYQTITICVYDTDSGSLLARGEFDTQHEFPFTFDPDGLALIIRTRSGLIRWRYTRQLTEPIPIPIVPDKLSAVWMTRDGRRGIVASEEIVAGIDLSSDMALWEFKHSSPMTAFDLCHDEELLAIGAANGDVFTLNTKTGKDFHLLSENIGTPVGSLKVSSDRSLIAASGYIPLSEQGYLVHLWHLADGAHSQLVMNQLGRSEVLRSYWGINHDGRFVMQVSKGLDRIYLRDALTGEFLPDISGSAWRSWATIPARNLLIGASREFTQVWHVEPFSGAKLLTKSKKPGIHLMKVSSDGQYFALASEQCNLVEMWSVADAAPIGSPLSMASNIKALAFNPDSEELAVLDRHGNLALWSYLSGENPIMNKIPVENPRLNQMVFHPDPPLIGVVDYDNYPNRLEDRLSKILFVNPFDGQTRYKPIQIDPGIHSMNLHSDGKTLFTSKTPVTTPPRDIGDFLSLWNIESGEQLSHAMHQGGVVGSEFSPDGKLLITPSFNNTTMLWDVSSGRQIGSSQDPGIPNRVAFHPNGRWFATTGQVAGRSRTELWDVSTQRRLGPAFSQNKLIATTASALDFALDGKELIWAFDDGEVYSRRIPELPTSNDDLRKQSWTALGMRFGDNDDLQALSAGEWQKLREEYFVDIPEYGEPVFDLALVSGGSLFAETTHGLLKFNKERQTWERSIFRYPLDGGIESTRGMLFTTTRQGKLYFSFNQSDGQKWSSVSPGVENIASSNVMTDGSRVYVNWQAFPYGVKAAVSQYSRLGFMDIDDRIWQPLPKSPCQVSSFATLNGLVYAATWDRTRSVQRQVPSLFIPSWSIAAIPNSGRPTDAMNMDWIKSYTGGAEKDLKEVQSRESRLGWKVYSGADATDRIDLTEATGEAGYATAYLFTMIESPQAQPATIALIADDMATVRINGEEVHRDQLVTDYSRHETRLIHVNLAPGKNRVLIKTVNDVRGGGPLQWSFDLTILLSNSNQIRTSPDGVNFQPVVMKPGWEVINRGIENLNVSCIENFEGILYAGTATDGVFRFHEESDEWKPFNPGIPARSITHLETNDEYLFAATIDDGIYRFDGESWVQTADELKDTPISVISVNGRSIYAGTWNGKTFESHDQGDTWTRMPAIPLQF